MASEISKVYYPVDSEIFRNDATECLLDIRHTKDFSWPQSDGIETTEMENEQMYNLTK